MAYISAFCPCLHVMFNSTRRQSQQMKKGGFQRGNQHSAAVHAARWGERVVSDAGAPAPAPRATYPPPSGSLIAPHHTSAVGTAAAAAPVDAEAMDAAAIHTTAPLPASAAGTKRARSPSREGGTGDAQGTSAEADAASDSDEADVCCPGVTVTRAEVVADEGGELYASDVVAPPPNQLGGATYGPTYGGARPSTCAAPARRAQSSAT